MLYVTTRNETETFTAQQVLNLDRSPDGGFFVPFGVPRFSDEEISTLAEKSFHQCVADVLNRLFPVNLSAWDILFCIGRKPVRFQTLGHRTVFAETWHNPGWNYSYLAKRLSLSLGSASEQVSDWMQIAVRASVLFGLCSDLRKSGVETFDAAFVSGNFAGPMSAWYARQWGLPIGNILCCCNENQDLWNLICHGELRTDGLSTPTVIPEADVTVPVALERLVFACGGQAEVSRYLDACRKGKSYIPGNAVWEKMRDGLSVSVVSNQRVMDTISGVFGAYAYLITPQSALAYAGLMDYRTRNAIMRQAIICSDQSPKSELAAISAATGLPEEELMEFL